MQSVVKHNNMMTEMLLLFWVVITAPSEQATGWSSAPTKWRSDHTRPWLRHRGQTLPAQNAAGWSSAMHKHTTHNYKIPRCTPNTWNHEDKQSVTSSPLAVSFLWVSASPRAEPSTPSSWKTTTHLLWAVHFFCMCFCKSEHPITPVGLFWPSRDSLSESQWWYKFLLPPLLQTECFPGGERWRWCSAISEVRHGKDG